MMTVKVNKDNDLKFRKGIKGKNDADNNDQQSLVESETVSDEIEYFTE